MCSLCAVLGPAHWAEEGSGRRERILRVRLINRLLLNAGLRLDDWNGSIYLLRDRKGRSEVVSDLGGMWSAAERLAGRPLDPLDPALLRSLEGHDSRPA
jgi:hypothetical protein